jgi:hypothetical protein
MPNFPKPKADILADAKKQIALAREYVQPKRVEFRDRLKLYNNQRKQRDKIGDTSMYNLINLMLALFYTDEMQVGFSGRNLGDADAATNLENLAKFDHEEMEMDILNYLTQWDRFFFGVGIREMTQWDNRRKTPIPKSMDTLSWLPDPAGGLTGKNFRFHGFEGEYLRTELTEEAGFFNQELLPSGKNKAGTEQDLTRQALQDAQNLGFPEYQRIEESKKTDSLDLVDFYTSITSDEDGIARKYLMTVNNEVTEIFRFEEIEPVLKEEKEDPSLIEFPIILNYYSPMRKAPFGVSVADLAEDKQRAKSVLKNLRIAARKADLYPMYLYNRDKIMNRRDLDFAFNKFIPVRGDVGDTVVRPINTAPAKQGEVLTDEASLDRDMEKATGSSQAQQAASSRTATTLGEQEIIQANADIRSLLHSRINGWGDKRFIQAWLRIYRQNFKKNDEKVIEVESAFGSQQNILRYPDFITKEDPKIKIGSKFELDQKRQRERLAFSTIFPLIAQDPSKPKTSRLFAERKLLRLHNATPDEISVMSPKTVDEMRADMENIVLGKDQPVDVDVLKEDHLSHLVIHAQAYQTDKTRQHIEAHKIAFFESGQAVLNKQMELAQAQNAGQQNNMAANQISNQNAQLNSNQPATGVSPEAA